MGSLDSTNFDPHIAASIVSVARAKIEELEMEVAARKLDLEELERAVQIEADARIAKSFATANITDAKAIEAARLEMEEEAAGNSEYDNEEDIATMKEQARPATSDTRQLSKLAGAYVSPQAGKLIVGERRLSQQQLSGWQYGEEPSITLRKYDCTACGDTKEYFEVMKMPCRDWYCRDCIHELFARSLKDESLFPPRCCRQHIPIEHVDIFLTRQIKDEFVEKHVEYNTENRTYCYHKPCSAFIAPEYCNEDRGYARCQKCPRLTCVECKQRHHGSALCPRDEETEQVLQLAQSAGWQRCGKCRTMVELNHGCHHMQCKCRHEFCYVCSAPWKNCDCPQWDDEMLLDRAERLVDRQQMPEGEDRMARVEEAARMLEENHNCDHTEFSKIMGQFECDECHDHLTRFIYQCQQCRIDLCWWCRFNRL